MRHVLLIEDDPSTRLLLTTLLDQAGYRVTAAEDGTEAVQTIRHEQVDLLITDLFMPGREGIETIRTLRQHGFRLPVLAISGGTVQGGNMHFLRAALAVGATSALRKPFPPAEFLSTVETLLAPAAPAQASQDLSAEPA